MKRIILISFVIIFFSCAHTQPPAVHEDELSTIPQPRSEDSEVSHVHETEEEKPVRYTLTFLAAGDNLLHETVYKSLKTGDSYNFLPVYAEIKDLAEKADLAFINQETVMAGEKYGFSGYPSFNTPRELASALAETGFNLINHANNHAMDMGEEGLLATLDLWDSISGVTVLGTQNSGIKHRIITMNNITLGFLGYTYGLNGHTLPDSKPDLVSLINRKNMAEDIDALRPLCDFLVVSMHWGDEYVTEPSPYQTGLAAFLAEHNVDLVIGHHSHVLQRFESLPRPDGKNTLCFYSLGNFVSHQRQKERILGALLCVTFVKEGEELSISDPGLIPVVCHFDQSLADTKVYPLYSYTEELLKNHRGRINDNDLTIDYFHSVMNGLQTNVIMGNPFADSAAAE